MESNCSRCGTKGRQIKEWTMTGRGKVALKIHAFVCPKCGRRWRRYET